ncbi:MAG: hypothetical protein ACI920_000739 [Saprospiraceae bacterium]
MDDFILKKIDQNFQGNLAEETKDRVDKMALLFMSKIQHLRDNPSATPH